LIHKTGVDYALKLCVIRGGGLLFSAINILLCGFESSLSKLKDIKTIKTARRFLPVYSKTLCVLSALLELFIIKPHS